MAGMVDGITAGVLVLVQPGNCVAHAVVGDTVMVWSVAVRRCV